MHHRFMVEPLGGREICLKCARRVAPAQVTMAEDMERRPGDESDS